MWYYDAHIDALLPTVKDDTHYRELWSAKWGFSIPCSDIPVWHYDERIDALLPTGKDDKRYRELWSAKWGFVIPPSDIPVWQYDPYTQTMVRPEDES